MKIVIASSIHPEAIEQLSKSHDVQCAFDAQEEDLISLIQDREVLIFRSGVQISAEVMAAAPDLQLLIRAGSGTDNVDLEYVAARGLRLVRVPQPGAKAVAEMAFAFMLALSRNLLEADRLTRRGHWAKHRLTGYLLTGKTLGVVGAGNIGTRVGRLGRAWGMEVLGCVEHPSPLKATRLLEQGIRLADLDEVLSRADYVSLHVPLKESTRNLINGSSLGKMKPGSCLINLARGGVVDEKALGLSLEQGHLRGAALDVHQQEGEGKISPLAKLPNVLLTPHIGAGTFDSQREIGQRVAEIVQSFESEQRAARREVGRRRMA